MSESLSCSHHKNFSPIEVQQTTKPSSLLRNPRLDISENKAQVHVAHRTNTE